MSHSQAVFYSIITSKSYTFKHEKSVGGKAAPVDFLTQIASNGWANLPLMFDGSYNCTAAGKACGSIISTEADGTVDFSCLSCLPIYLSCDPKAPCPTSAAVDGKCPFGYDGSCA